MYSYLWEDVGEAAEGITLSLCLFSIILAFVEMLRGAPEMETSFNGVLKLTDCYSESKFHLMSNTHFLNILTCISK